MRGISELHVALGRFSHLTKRLRIKEIVCKELVTPVIRDIRPEIWKSQY